MTKVRIEWVDSYGAMPGWQEVEGFKPERLVVESIGYLVYEDKTVISIAQNYADETEYTPKQMNGVMTIPKECIKNVEALR